MHWKCPKIGVFGDFGGESWNFYLSKPQKAPPCVKTRVLTYHSPKSAHGFDQGAIQRNSKIMSSAAILGFQFLIFEHTALFGVGHRLCMSNFIMIWLTVQKLLAFLFFHRKCIESVQKLGGFGDFGGENLNIYLSRPQKAPPWAKPRVLTRVAAIESID